MQALSIRLKKGRGGPDVITCTRADGSTTWERLHANIATHDLAHFAFESELGVAHGFFGLLASGWSITGFLDRESRGELPPQAGATEFYVGRFWQEALDGSRSSVAEFNATLDAMAASRKGLELPHLTKDEIERVRTRLAELVAQWYSLAPGETLELEFVPAAK